MAEMPPHGRSTRELLERVAALTGDTPPPKPAEAIESSIMKSFLHVAKRRADEKGDSPEDLARTSAAERPLRLAALNLMQDFMLARREREQAAEARERADAARRESETRLQLALDVAAMGTFVWRLPGEASDPDARMRELCGLPAHGAVDLRTALGAMLHRDDRARFQAAVSRALASESEGQLQEDLRVLRPEGAPRWIALDARVRFAGDPPRAVLMAGAVIDITVRKQTEEALREALAETERARAQTEAAGRAKDHFLAALSHELRTPLTPVMMATVMLRKRNDLPDSVRAMLDMIARNVQLESRLVDDLLDITRIERGKLELVHAPVDLHEAIGQAIDVSKPDIDGKQQVLQVELQAASHRLVGDSDRLQQVVWNLLKNASKFTPRGGSIRVRSFSDARNVFVEVSDKGIGIEPKALPRIFEAFAQADPSITRSFGGLGLGLAIARASVSAHGGEIWAQSEGAGHGAAFTLSLPLPTAPCEGR